MPVDLPILDPHVHFWDPRTTPRRVSTVGRALAWRPLLLRHVGFRLFPKDARHFVGLPDYAMRAWMPADLAAQQAGYDVRGLVHVQAGWHDHTPLGPVGETRWLASLNHGPILGIVGEARVDRPDLEAVIAAHRAASPRVVGIRDMLAHDPDRGVLDFSAPDRSATEAFRSGLRALGASGLTFDAWCYGPQLASVAAALEQAPGTRTALCHFGSPIGAGGPFAGHGATPADRASIVARWRDDLARVASLPHVHAKLSGLGMPILGFGFHTRAEPPSVAELADRFGPFVEHALRVFGPSRCFFASNFPMDAVSAPWARFVDALAAVVQGEDLTTRRGLFHDNAARFYGLPTL